MYSVFLCVIRNFLQILNPTKLSAQIIFQAESERTLGRICPISFRYVYYLTARILVDCHQVGKTSVVPIFKKGN